MLARLLESKAERNRSVWGAVVSTIAHTTAIGVAVFATAQARVDQPGQIEVVRWMNPPAQRAPVARPPAAAAPVRSVERPALAGLPDLRLLERIDVVTPPVDLIPALLSLNPAPFPAGAATSGLTSDATGRVEITEPLSADQVERQVYLRPGSSPPRYPDALRVAGVEGQVVVLFVVNESGRVELASMRFMRSDNALFEAAVRDALGSMRFVAAEVGGRKVRQLVQMPFVFRLSR